MSWFNNKNIANDLWHLWGIHTQVLNDYLILILQFNQGKAILLIMFQIPHLVINMWMHEPFIYTFHYIFTSICDCQNAKCACSQPRKPTHPTFPICIVWHNSCIFKHAVYILRIELDIQGIRGKGWIIKLIVAIKI
jgi:hypothetical protein